MDLKTLGRNIRLTRQSQGLTQEVVAMDLGCSLNTYTKFERGETNIPFTRLTQIAKYFNVTVDVLKSGEHFEQKETPTPNNGSERAYTDVELTEAFMRADDATREAIRLLLKLK